MSYEAIDRLTTDVWFQARVRACCTEQADTYRADTRPPISALARDVAKGGGESVLCFVRLLAAAPGFAVKAMIEGAEGLEPNFDQSRVTDGEILAAVQAHWPDVAELYFADG